MDFKDYYAILGVPPDADEQTIKKAYRKLARQYHPDVNPGDKKAEERFKEINEAYEALSDPERRRKYDQLREQYQRWQQRGGVGEFDWGPWQTAPGQTVYTYTTVSPEDLEDLFGSESPFSDFFSTIFGQPRGVAPRGPQRGRDIELPVEISLEEAFHGTTRSLQAGTRRIEAKIPVGARTGTRVRLAGQGRPGIAGGPPGDLYLLVTVLPHPQFERDGDDLTTTVPVDCFTAIAGGEVRVPTLDGSVLLKIPPRTQADQVFRLRGKGMPRLERPTERGDLFARVKLVLPEALSDAEIETIRALARERGARKKG
ncbi:MAG: J domain-containing protein [Roseiflexaceae bacterium]|nr:J domain-containing protein [Roseiflexaceae bacterium]